MAEWLPALRANSNRTSHFLTLMRKWSIKLGRLWGVDVYLHSTFLIFLAFLAMIQPGISAAIDIVILTCAVFACVLLHEFGHVRMAARYGVGTKDVTLLPIGGVARLDRMPSRPMEEFWVAVAGPAVNLAIAAVLYVILWMQGSPIPGLSGEAYASGSLLQSLFAINISLILFNMLPAFPMDGGRVLRALLAMSMDYFKATQIASRVAKVMAAGFVIAGIFGNPLLAVIGIFVWMGSTQEVAAAKLRSSLGDARVSSAMMTSYQELHPDDRLSRAVEILLEGWQHDFPVLESRRMVGVLERHRLVEALAKQGADGLVRHAMQPVQAEVEEWETLTDCVLERDITRSPLVAVKRDHLVVGFLNMENIVELAHVRDALSRHRKAS